MCAVRDRDHASEEGLKVELKENIERSRKMISKKSTYLGDKTFMTY